MVRHSVQTYSCMTRKCSSRKVTPVFRFSWFSLNVFLVFSLSMSPVQIPDCFVAWVTMYICRKKQCMYTTYYFVTGFVSVTHHFQLAAIVCVCVWGDGLFFEVYGLPYLGLCNCHPDSDSVPLLEHSSLQSQPFWLRILPHHSECWVASQFGKRELLCLEGKSLRMYRPQTATTRELTLAEMRKTCAKTRTEH